MLEWGTFKESSSATDIRYYPVAFPNVCLYAGGMDLKSSGSYRSRYFTWFWADNPTYFLLGMGNDYDAVCNVQCIFLGF